MNDSKDQKEPARNQAFRAGGRTHVWVAGAQRGWSLRWSHGCLVAAETEGQMRAPEALGLETFSVGSRADARP